MDLATWYVSKVAISGWCYDPDGFPMQGNDTGVMISIA
jgi:hypothetical protein